MEALMAEWAGLVEMMAATASYHGIDLAGHDPVDGFRAAATELRFPGYLADGDDGPANVYAAHNYVVRALGVFAKRAGLDVPDAARCGGEKCGRLRIPGFGTCHWHGASAAPDDVILATMRAEIGVV